MKRVALGRHLRVSRMAIIAAALVLASACSNSHVALPTPRLAPGAIEVTGLSGLDWIDATRLIVSRSVNAGDVAAPHHLFIVDLGNQTSIDLGLAALSDCQRTEYLHPSRMADGKILAIRRCIPLQPSSDWPTWVIAVDIATKSVEELTPNLSSGSVVNIASAVWRLDRNGGFVSIGSRICQTIQRVGASGLTPLDLPLTIDGRTFNLADMSDPGATDCSTTGQADLPAISPKEGSLAFTASSAAIGQGGQGRLDAPSSVLMTLPTGTQPRVVVEKFENPIGLGFSPDGNCLAVGGGPETGTDAGTFVAHLATQTFEKVSNVAVSPKWSPDGTGLAGVVSDGPALAAKEWLVILPAHC